MQIFISKLLGSLISLAIVFSIIFIVWFLFARKREKITKWIGLYGFGNKNKVYLWMMIGTIFFILVGTFMLYIFKDVKTASSDFYSLGFLALPAIIVHASLGTALPEEVLFRGFILKRLENKFSFNVGNIVQSLLFGLVHGLAFIAFVGIFKGLLLFIFTGLLAFLIGYINEKKAEGSILPGIILHFIANVFSGVCSAWMLF